MQLGFMKSLCKAETSYRCVVSASSYVSVIRVKISTCETQRVGLLILMQEGSLRVDSGILEILLSETVVLWWVVERSKMC